MAWISAQEPPDTDDEVLIWWHRQGAFQRGSQCYLGSYSHALGYWRPLGSNGNFNDEITHWMPKPKGPEEE